jgi:plastocyanin
MGANIMQGKYFSFLFAFLFLVSVTTACSNAQNPPPAVTPPAISVQITKDYCPSVEVQVGMQIAWTNLDTVGRVLWLERKDEKGVIIDAGGTDQLQPGNTFSITLSEPGQYTYYCSKDHKAFGSIMVSP